MKPKGEEDAVSRQQLLMQAAIDVCHAGIEAGQSPFGAAVATVDGELVCATHNTVRMTCDCTAHAEINAIREACKKLGTIDLSGHVMFTTCEPCPMCAAAIHWARLEAVFFGATIADAEMAGFNELSLACTSMYELGGSNVVVHDDVRRTDCAALFDAWKNGPNPASY
jgi:guanine deaminase